MFHPNKRCDSPTQMEESSLTRSPVEPSLSNTSSNLIHAQPSTSTKYQTISMATNDHRQPSVAGKSSFSTIIWEQLLKGLSVFYFAFGLMFSVVYFTRQIIVDTTDADVTWQWVGIVNSVFICIIVVLIIISKGIIYRNATIPQNTKCHYLFYILVAIPAGFTFIDLIFFFIRQYEEYLICTGLSDLLLPICRLVFLVFAVILIGDLITYRKELNELSKAFIIYKFAVVLTFTTCLNILIFEFLHDESFRYQIFASRVVLNSSSIFCYNKTINGTTVEIVMATYIYLHVCSIICAIGSVILLIKPIQQFYENEPDCKTNQENRPLLRIVSSSNIENDFRFIPKYTSLVIIVSIGIFILSCSDMFLHILKDYDTKDIDKVNIFINALPLPAYIICGFANVYMLRLLQSNYDLKPASNISNSHIYVLWVSLAGTLLHILRDFLKSIHYLRRPDSKGNSEVVHGIGVVNQALNTTETVMQFMMMDFLIRIDWNSKVKRPIMSRLYYCCILLISINAAKFVSNYYFQSREYQSGKEFGPFPKMTWDILSTLSNPFIILFRGITPVFLIIFLYKLNLEIIGD